MAGKIYINDEVKNIIGGKVYIDGQVKTITHGKVYIDGQIKTISFVNNMPKVTKAQGSSVRFSSPTNFTFYMGNLQTLPNYEYSTDGVTFQRLYFTANGGIYKSDYVSPKEFDDGYAIYIRGIGNSTVSTTGYSVFAIGGDSISVSGDSRNLLNYNSWSTIDGAVQGMYQRMFYGRTALEDLSDFNVHIFGDGTFACNSICRNCTYLINGVTFSFENSIVSGNDVLSSAFSNCPRLKTRYQFSNITFSSANALNSFYNASATLYSSSTTQHSKQYKTPNVNTTQLQTFAKLNGGQQATSIVPNTIYYVEDDCIII